MARPWLHSVIEKCKHFSATLVLHTFRAVEGTFARVQDVVEAGELRCFGEGGFRLVPDFVGTHALWTPAASALRLSNENKRVCFRCIRLVRYSGRVENFTTISSKPKGASASLFASVMTVCKQPVATLGSWIVVVDLTPLASAAAPRSCRKTSFSSRHSACTLFLTVHAAVALRDMGIPHTIVWVGLYCKASRAHLRYARAALATKPRFASLVPKGSLSLTHFYFVKITPSTFPFNHQRIGNSAMYVSPFIFKSISRI